MPPIAALTAVCLAMLLVTSCGEDKKKKQDAAQYKTMVVSRKDVTLERQYSARLTGRQIVEVRPQVSGCITRILTGEGQTVRKGQTLFIIDQVPYRAGQSQECRGPFGDGTHELRERDEITGGSCGGRCLGANHAQCLNGG